VAGPQTKRIERARIALAEAQRLYAALAELRRRRDPAVTPTALRVAARAVVEARKKLQPSS
jgi:hypothetical protein